MDVLRTAALVLATLSTGLTAGVFGLYAHTIMPGLATADDRTFVGAFQVVDRAIINPWFLGGGFAGALVTTAVTVVSSIGQPGLVWIAVALGLYLCSVLITVVVHLPLNDALKAAGHPARMTDPAAVRARFHETRWRGWNIVRAWTSTAAFAALCWALVLHDRSG